MDKEEKIVNAILDEVYDRVENRDLSMEDLDYAALTLLRIKEYKKDDIVRGSD